MERVAAGATGPYLIMAIPLLVEGKSRDRVHRILVVDVDESVQLQRLMARDGGTLQEAQAILAAQASRARRLNAATDVLVNAGTVPELRHSVDQLHQRYLSMADTLGAADGHVT